MRKIFLVGKRLPGSAFGGGRIWEIWHYREWSIQWDKFPSWFMLSEVIK